MTYSTAFKNIDKRTVEATKKLIKSGFWKKDVSTEYKVKICNEWLETVSEVYGIEVPEFRFDTSEVMYMQTGGGYYEPWAKRITLFKKFSLVTFLHEFRHHMQHEMELSLFRRNHEEDARGWSVSLFKKATPKSYKNAVEKGLLHFS
ncbi:hypothetical protein [Geobacillus phage GR1]|nr:hypothetical protein [Geobacillus phage GR1]